MSRIHPVTAPEGQSAELLDGVRKLLGSTPNIFTSMAHSPAALSFYVGSINALSKTKLSGKTREQLALATAGANSCDYCASAHTAFGKMQKIPEGELADNLHGQASDAKTQAAISFALKVLDTRGHITETDLEAVRNAGYSDAEIIEIVAVTAQNIFTNYFNSVFKTEIDFPAVSTAMPMKAA